VTDEGFTPVHEGPRRGCPPKDYTGVRVGSYTGVRPLGTRPPARNVVWLFRCGDCGEERQWDTSRIGNLLRAHSTPRCACGPALRGPDGAELRLGPEPRLPPPRVDDGDVTRDQLRSRRRRDVRKRTESMLRITKHELTLGRLLYPEPRQPLPATRGDCAGGPRPCPLVRCRWHLAIDVGQRTGALTFNFPDLGVDELEHSCALDVADAGGATLEEVGVMMNLTRERVRQVEVKAMAKLERAGAMVALREYSEEGPVGKRRLPVLQGQNEEST
jgi:hypothetical protein